ncbi:HD domain-containing protein [Candidatus Woesearchaeota archaeon]|nr:HD domain-containing protein [Candidatus Woesearchaeota archaeon]
MRYLIGLFSEIVKLKRVKRTGWAREGVPDSESVADHGFGTAMLCCLIGEKLAVNKEKLLKMALIHDLAEIETGDIVSQRGTKITCSLKDKFKKEKAGMVRLFSKAQHSGEYVKLWLEFEEQKTREAIILKQIDKLEMAFQALDYENDVEPSKLNEFWEDAGTTIKEPFLIELFNELEKRRKNYKK